MSTRRKTFTGAVEGFEVTCVKKSGRKNGRRNFIVQNPYGEALNVNEDELFDLAEMLDDLCDSIEDGEF